jgi:NADP-dependent 3-hydroxy acid dehydrogenase YdfG
MVTKVNCDLRGRRVLVTGASSGLGAHFASLFAACKAEVILAGRRIGVLEEIVQRLRAEGGTASCMQVDINDAASRKAMADSVGELDVLVNNAGVVIDKPAVQQTESDWDAVVDTNLKAMFSSLSMSLRRSKHDKAQSSTSAPFWDFARPATCCLTLFQRPE